MTTIFDVGLGYAFSLDDCLSSRHAAAVLTLTVEDIQFCKDINACIQ